MDALHALSVVAGGAFIVAILVSALETVVLPRRGFTRIARFVFATVHRLLVHSFGSRATRDNLRGLFAPVSLVSLPLVWMLTNTLAFALVFWGIGTGTFEKSFVTSGSSLFTLGFAEPEGVRRIWLTFVEATVGLGLVALLISYLPTIYSAYNARERGITMLRPFAGTPASAAGLLLALHRFNMLASPAIWTTAASWAVDLDQSHTSFPALTYFPPQDLGQSWVSFVGTVLDGAALLLANTSVRATDAISDDTAAYHGPMLALVYGLPAIGSLAAAAGLPLGPPRLLAEVIAHSAGETPEVSVRREEFDEACGRLRAAGVLGPAAQPDAWHRYACIRSGYDRALRGLAALTAATPAPWTTDRPAPVGRPRFFGRRPLAVDWTVRPAP